MVINPRARTRTGSRKSAPDETRHLQPIAQPAPRGVNKRLWLLICALVLIATPGCKSKNARSDFFLPSTHSELLPPRSGSLAELKDKEEDKRRKQAEKERGPQDTTVVLVAYDEKGKPTAVELRRSSGNAANDRRVLEHVYKHRTFPPGKANMILVEVDPKTLPKPAKSKDKDKEKN